MNKPRSLFTFILFSLFFIGCHGTSNDPFEAVKFNAFDANLNKRVQAYQEITYPNLANQKIGNPKVYIDFSNGIIQAYTSNTDNQKLIEWIAQILTSDNSIEWYKLANSEIAKMTFTPKELFSKVVDPNSYSTDIMAPIEKAVLEITSFNNDALLVTDFEEYELQGANKGKEQFMDFAKQPFESWLAKGNSVTFYITNDKENSKDGRVVDKHLYYIVFTCGNKSDNSLLSHIEYALKGRTVKVERFDLTSTPFVLSNEYGAEKTGGIFYDNSGKDEKTKNILDFKKDTYINGLPKNNHFEFYEFGLDWKTISDLKTEYQKQNQFKDFFRKLFIDLSNEDIYTINDLDIRVYDVTEDFTHFAKCNEALNHKPNIEKGSNGEDKFKDGNDNVAVACYSPNGKIKDEWVFKAKSSPELKEIFTLNRELFNNTKTTSNKSKVEIGSQFHPNFNLKNIPNPSGLLRVDVIISKVEPNLANPKLDLFKWESITIKGKPNQALYESIRNTIGSEKVKPINKVIYSYYIKTL